MQLSLGDKVSDFHWNSTFQGRLWKLAESRHRYEKNKMTEVTTAEQDEKLKESDFFASFSILLIFF